MVSKNLVLTDHLVIADMLSLVYYIDLISEQYKLGITQLNTRSIKSVEKDISYVRDKKIRKILSESITAYKTLWSKVK